MKLCPVNYSVAKNEDVFEYIKRDILLKLNELCIYDNNIVETIIKSLISWETIKETLSFLSYIPKARTLLSILKEVFDNYKKNNVSFEEYDDTFKSQRGGLYENDAYTLLIQAGLEKIKNGFKDENGNNEMKGRRTLLIIDDLDRLDPAHLFRILNVVSAHIDDNKDTNKFGFDNIVIAMDYEVTEHIFHHFYGQEANYEGYISKFLSSQPFLYSITDILRSTLLEKIQSQIGDNISVKSFPSLINKLNKATLRDCEKWFDIDTSKCFTRNSFSVGMYNFLFSYPTFTLLIYMNAMGVNFSELCDDLNPEKWNCRDLSNFSKYIGLIAPVLFCETRYKCYKDFKGVFYSFKPKEDVISSIDSFQIWQSSANPDEILTINKDNVRTIINNCIGNLDSFLIIGGWKTQG